MLRVVNLIRKVHGHDEVTYAFLAKSDVLFYIFLFIFCLFTFFPIYLERDYRANKLKNGPW